MSINLIILVFLLTKWLFSAILLYLGGHNLTPFSLQCKFTLSGQDSGASLYAARGVNTGIVKYLKRGNEHSPRKVLHNPTDMSQPFKQ